MARITEQTKNHLSHVISERADERQIPYEDAFQEVLAELRDPLLNQAIEENYVDEGDTEPETPSSRRRREERFGVDE